MEFNLKGKQRAVDYAIEKSSSIVFTRNHIKDYVSGYNQALEDSKAKEMLEMLKRCERTLREVYELETTEIKQLIKQATEL